jgi:glycyl-tRNA synthetase beta chain
MNNLLLEIGAEELPAGYIDPALKALSSLLLKKLKEHHIPCGDAKTFGTPRRLAVMVENVLPRQTAVTTKIMGPPQKAAFDASGRPLVPAVKFAEKAGVSLKDLTITETDKGAYVSAVITQKGLLTKTVLKSVLPEVILSIPFPKSMRWADVNIEFARPIQSILAILGKEAICFALEKLKSGRHTFGHRFMHPGKIEIKSTDDYIDQLSRASVMIDVDQRKSMIHAEIARTAKEIGAKALPDEELVDVVTHLVEYPAVAAGKFDEKFLRLPDEILITAMREHQKYFAVAGLTGKLMPNFIVVNNTPAKNMALVVKGHERVLRARLEDAMFFFENDVAAPFEASIEKLKGVLFQANLGSMYDKTLRVGSLAATLVDLLQSGGDLRFSNASVKANVIRAARLCKADLVSQIVIEFPKLQGIMGRVYAERAKEPQEVSRAIEEHYRPTGSGGILPASDAGAVVAVCDKTDSICGCFLAGLIPTGASDPYALRRQGIGIIQIMLEKGFTFSPAQMIRESITLYPLEDKVKTDEVIGKIILFLKDRLANILAERGFSKDIIAAVVDVSVDCVPDVLRKVEALEKLKCAPDFEPLAAAFKRVVNIIKKSDFGLEKNSTSPVNPDLFEKSCEADLLTACGDVEHKVFSLVDKGRFDDALLTISTLRDPVDAFFDGVLVMAKDDKIRNNRLALLNRIASIFQNIADFSKIST